MDLVKDRKYDEARYFRKASLFDGEDSRDFRNGCRTRTPLEIISFEGHTAKDPTAIEGTVLFNASEVTPTAACVSRDQTEGTVSSACGRSTPLRMVR